MLPKFAKVACAFGALATLLPVTSAVPYGLQIYQCTKPGVIAPGFDDGPWIYSEDILDRMGATGFIATWFINGANKGNIYDYNSTLRRMISMGHQIGSHTWSHKDLATLTADGVRQEMTLLEDAMMNILGYFPYYMRPPFLSVNANALQVLKELQYHVIIGDLNTKDWEYQSPSGIEQAKKLFTDGLDMGYTIVEAHEQEPYSHDILIDHMIKIVKDRGLKTVTVAECLQDSNMYRSVRTAPDPNATTTAEPEPTVVYSLNGRCGNINAGNNLGWTCPPNGGRCCSKYGNCGSGPDYCASNVCQPAFGLCNPAPSTTSYRDEAAHTTNTGAPTRTVANTETAKPSSTAGLITPDGTCGMIGSGKNKGYSCKAGACCSKYGNCGTTSDYCAATVCQSAFGKCDPAPGRGSVTPDGTCGDFQNGKNNGYVCKTGMCCSKYGNCGTTSDYCAASQGCQSAFGVCTGVTSSSARLSSVSSSVIAASSRSSSSAIVASSTRSVANAPLVASPVVVSSTSSVANAPLVVSTSSSVVPTGAQVSSAASTSSANAPPALLLASVESSLQASSSEAANVASPTPTPAAVVVSSSETASSANQAATIVSTSSEPQAPIVPSISSTVASASNQPEPLALVASSSAAVVSQSSEPAPAAAIVSSSAAIVVSSSEPAAAVGVASSTPAQQESSSAAASEASSPAAAAVVASSTPASEPSSTPAQQESSSAAASEASSPAAAAVVASSTPASESSSAPVVEPSSTPAPSSSSVISSSSVVSSSSSSSIPPQ